MLFELLYVQEVLTQSICYDIKWSRLLGQTVYETCMYIEFRNQWISHKHTQRERKREMRLHELRKKCEEDEGRGGEEEAVRGREKKYLIARRRKGRGGERREEERKKYLIARRKKGRGGERRGEEERRNT